MKKFLCTLMLVAFAIGYAQQSEPVIIPIQSATYNTERQVCVVLPKDYDKYPDRRYAVLYVFDAQNDRLFNLAVATAAYLEGNDFMQTIIVGIKSQNRWDEFLATPQHQETIDTAVKYFGKDFTFGNADKLAEHLKSEVFPMVEKQYRTLPTRLAIGHSLGGTFVTYCNVAYPQLFDATISISPNLVFDKQSMLEKIEKFRNTEQSFNAYNFIAFGRKDSYETNFYPGTQKAIALFEKQVPEGLMFAYKEFDDANHSSILPHGITAGLSDYYNKIFLTGTNLTAYYDSLIAGKHITLNADEANYLAFNCHNQDKTDDAITITAWAINKLPEDYSLHGSMGEFLEKKKNKPEAAKYYQKTITLLKKKKASLDSKAFTEKLDYYNNNLKRVSGK